MMVATPFNRVSEPGESATIPLSWAVSEAGGELTLTITLDPDDLIIESDETNNTLTETFTVESCERPIIFIPGILGTQLVATAA